MYKQKAKKEGCRKVKIMIMIFSIHTSVHMLYVVFLYKSP